MQGDESLKESLRLIYSNTHLRTRETLPLRGINTELLKEENKTNTNVFAYLLYCTVHIINTGKHPHTVQYSTLACRLKH